MNRNQLKNQLILDYYRSDIDELDHINTLKNGEVLSDRALLEKMERESEFNIFNEFKSFQIVGYDKVFDGTVGITIDDIKNMIKLGLLKNDLNLIS